MGDMNLRCFSVQVALDRRFPIREYPESPATPSERTHVSAPPPKSEKVFEVKVLVARRGGTTPSSHSRAKLATGQAFRPCSVLKI